MRELDSKDFWYFSMASIILSFVTPYFLGSFGLLISGFICGIAYLKKRDQERKIQFLNNQLNFLKESSNILGNLFGRELEEIKRPSPRRKPTSRKRK